MKLMPWSILFASLTITSVSFAADSSDSAAKGDPVAGKSKAASCSACHGVDGNSTNPEWPSLAGQNAHYIAKQLHDFKAEKGSIKGRFNPTMSPMAAPLNDQDILDIAAYYSEQEISGGKADAKKVSLGEMIYRGGNTNTGLMACAACHGPAGEGMNLGALPALYGQHVTYTKAQLNAFKSGERHNDSGNMMTDIAKKMTDEEIDAVAEYLTGLRPE